MLLESTSKALHACHAGLCPMWATLTGHSSGISANRGSRAMCWELHRPGRWIPVPSGARRWLRRPSGLWPLPRSAPWRDVF